MRFCKACGAEVKMMTTPDPHICCEACLKLSNGEMTREAWIALMGRVPSPRSTPVTGSSGALTVDILAQTPGTELSPTAIGRRATFRSSK